MDKIKEGNMVIKLNEPPEGCECGDTHSNNKTVCQVCWATGYRYDSPDYPRVWWNPLGQERADHLNLKQQERQHK